MKKSYKLFGTVWDGMQIQSCCLNNNNKIQDAQTDNSQVIKITDLLRINTQQQLDEYIKKYNTELIIHFDIDYTPRNANKTLLSFYEKRVSQIYFYLNSKFKKF